MICSRCGKNEARVRIVRAGKVIYLCEECARERGIVFTYPMETSSQVCPQCGYTLKEFILTGLLGCPLCYTAFGDYLEGVLLGEKK